MASLQIKNVPDGVLAEVKRRATQRHLTLRDYLLELIVLDQRTPTVKDWLETLDQVESSDVSADQVAAAIDAARGDRDAQLGTRPDAR